MLSKGIVKRFVPFLLTFAAGLFIASFFVSIAMPTFRGKNRENRRFVHRGEMQFEMDRLRQENEQLKRELEFHGFGPAHLNMPEVPPVDLEAPAPPRPPRYR
ncbi:MAG TPA: hypothetical protein VK468_10510 [Pyrinomonadaceae bacterium]|jgi:hypothetical protein|nr:hypothetical protein [Pyrinomonadaceae bacterium]